jgi:hypothetical protein
VKFIPTMFKDRKEEREKIDPASQKTICLLITQMN